MLKEAGVVMSGCRKRQLPVCLHVCLGSMHDRLWLAACLLMCGVAKLLVTLSSQPVLLDFSAQTLTAA